jgi:hypothetical protein
MRPTASLQSLASSLQHLEFQSSHPDIKRARNSFKIKARSIFNRHTFGVFALSSHSPLAASHSPLSERKSKGEEKDPARRSPWAKAANRYRAQLENPQPHENKDQKNF